MCLWVFAFGVLCMECCLVYLVLSAWEELVWSAVSATGLVGDVF